MPYLFRVLFLILTVIIIPITTHANAADIVRQFFIQTADAEFINPNVAQRIDGGFIIAGSANMTAWATKLDNQGRTLWRYNTGLREVMKPFRGFPEFRGIAAMPDDSVYLCGDIPRPHASGLTSALLTHLDKQGRVLNEQWVTPHGDVEVQIASSFFAGCAMWNDGLVVIGRVQKQSDPREGGIGIPIPHLFYWLIKLGASGNIIWQKYIPVPAGPIFPVDPTNFRLLATRHNLVFSATDGNKTDIVSLTEHGDIYARNTIPGYLRLVQPMFTTGDIQLIGRGGVQNSAPPDKVLVTLDTDLHVTRRVTHPLADKFYPNITYQMANKTLVAFGEGIHLLGQSYRGEIVRFDQALNEQDRLDLEVNGIDSAGDISVACPGVDANQFLVAKKAVSKDSENNSVPQDSGSTTFKRGMIIQIVKLK